MLKRKDFVPHSEKPPGIFTQRTYESFDAAAAAAGEWIEQSGVTLVQIETVMLPNMRPAGETSSAKYHVSHTIDSQWFQFVRVWYRE